MSQTSEFAFESYVETILFQRSGWHPCPKTDWDPERALFPERVIAFLQDTQSKLWADMHALHGDGLKPLLLNTLVKELQLKGMIHVLSMVSNFTARPFAWPISSLPTASMMKFWRSTPKTSSPSPARFYAIPEGMTPLTFSLL